MRRTLRLQANALARVPAVAWEPLAWTTWRVTSLFDARLRWSGLERLEMGNEMRDRIQVDRRQVCAAKLLEQLIDRRIYFGRELRGVERWPDLVEVADALASTIARLRAAAPGRPVIVSPFHYVSQYANVYVIDELAARLKVRSMGVVSAVPQDLFGDDGRLIPNIEVLYTFGVDNRNGLGLRVLRSLRRNGVIALFADVPPYTLARYPMETVGVSLFGRDARLHNGVFRIGATLDAWLLPFYLRFERGRFSAVQLEPIALARTDAPQQLAGAIEQALIDNYARSLVAGHPALYAFAPTR
jgi:hypothetical protein